jgi:hypothetical protein
VLAPLALASALALCGQTPNDSLRAAYSDLSAHVAPEKRFTTRYLSLTAVPPEQRGDYLKALTYAVNSTSFRSVLSQLAVVGDGSLVRVDLESLEWDYGARSVRLKELERRGVDFGLKDHEARRLFLDPWEQFARDDPFFQVGYYDSEYKYVRGWLDPTLVNAARHCTNSIKPVLRADWVLNRILQENFPPAFQGYYSTLLMLPRNEQDLYKVFLVDIIAVDKAENKLRQGGAVLESAGVAQNNRELQMIYSAYGPAVKYIWRTLDVDVDARYVKNEKGDQVSKSVVESLAGTLIHDAREIIGTLPNGLQWWYLANGKGQQQAVAPEKVAQVKTPLVPVKETQVISPWKCIECHYEGIRSFDDVISKMMLDPTIALQIKSKYHQKNEAAALQSALEDFYLSPLGSTIKLQQQIFAANLKACCGMTGTQTATLILGFVEGYQYDSVNPVQAAREMGYPIEEAKYLWRKSYNPILAVLSSGRSIRRGAWDQSFGDGMRAASYPFEAKNKGYKP